MSLRQKIWNKLAVEWRPDRVHDQVRTIDFDELPTHFDPYLKGMVRGPHRRADRAGHASVVRCPVRDRGRRVDPSPRLDRRARSCARASYMAHGS